jgi:hypothetical protein
VSFIQQGLCLRKIIIDKLDRRKLTNILLFNSHKIYIKIFIILQAERVQSNIAKIYLTMKIFSIGNFLTLQDSKNFPTL